MFFSPLLRTPVVLAFLLCGLTACGSTQETDTAPADIAAVPTGQWDEADAKNVADEMIGEGMLGGEWLRHWEKTHEGRPTVIIGPIKNKTMKAIGEEIVIKEIERNLVTSDTVQFAAAKEVRQALRRERQEEEVTRCCMGQGNSRLNEMAQEKGADVLVLGTISSAVQDSLADDRAALLYTVKLELVNLEKNATVWLQEKKIKKVVKRSEGTM